MSASKCHSTKGARKCHLRRLITSELLTACLGLPTMIEGQKLTPHSSHQIICSQTLWCLDENKLNRFLSPITSYDWAGSSSPIRNQRAIIQITIAPLLLTTTTPMFNEHRWAYEECNAGQREQAQLRSRWQCEENRNAWHGQVTRLPFWFLQVKRAPAHTRSHVIQHSVNQESFAIAGSTCLVPPTCGRFDLGRTTSENPIKLFSG